MPEFDACYFCGVAVDAPVADYDVVPAAVDDEEGPIASLCPSCKRKLEKVLEPTVRRLGATGENAAVTLEPITDEDDAQEKSRSDSRSATPTPTIDDTPDGRNGAADDEPAPGTGSFDDGIEVEPADGTHDDEQAEHSGEQRDEQSTSPSANASAAAEANARDTDDADPDAPERPETETYNQVVRLLQNREFPVDRTEFETLASSAYDVSPAECERVIAYAIYRGELDERDGLLEKPDEA
ncbi:hypothetical protein [Natranaeroarchaeum aerophilus]|uniref:Uncharacterized protein n=1 Tax=Natranaeroarchaeum aerophilus TaxID=2917711 RepID=A0AAE3FSL5_9EURY|nr:hypothetical protein [Natranaeroarchaeum aerophilus]MCL9814817.1 hypothetical protein [Natranaeroarchaeum aerophilus]